MPNLYVTEPGARLEIEAGRWLVSLGDEVQLSVPATRVEQVVIAGGVGVTTPALGLLLDRGIGLVLLTLGGAFRGRLSAGVGKNVGLRRQQYRRAEDPAFCLALSTAFVAGKLGNARTLCLRLDATNDDPTTLGVVADLHRLIAALDEAPDRDAVLGIEGQGGRRYFDAFRRHLDPPWELPRRARRPPPDPVNALLSLLYTLLHESCYSALDAVGLDPYCGYYHAERYGRASLASDLMEEFRPIIADSVALWLLNKQILSLSDFRPVGEGRGVHLSQDAWRHVATAYQRRLATTVRPPGVSRAISYQKVLEVQARALRRVIEGEDSAYAPFRTR
ncbi:MAG: CRISPR-associated endonuclease Cas1 [Chloroflexia bacterium]|nr:CRISPR-associated endonuclease Cas1 [Chloroflexia bacterium]